MDFSRLEIDSGPNCGLTLSETLLKSKVVVSVVVVRGRRGLVSQAFRGMTRFSGAVALARVCRTV